MKYIKKYSILFLLLSAVWGQNLFPILGGQRVGTSVFTFLNIGVSASAVGMGEAVVAMSQDASSIYYNPAIVAQFKEPQLILSKVTYPADIFYDYASYTQRIFRQQYFGISGGILHMAPMMETTEYLPTGTGNYFVFQDRFFALTYGARMTDRFSFGVTLKYVQEDLAQQSMGATMMDMGTFYWTGYQSLRFSASLLHFGPEVKPNGTYEKRILDFNTGEEIVDETSFQAFSPPTIFRVGTAMNLWNTDQHSLEGAIQLNHPVDNAEYIVFGVELSLYKMLYIRSGYKLNKLEENYSFGVGFHVPIGSTALKIDYSYSNFQHLTDPTRLSIEFEF